MNCLVLPLSLIRRRSMGYRHLSQEKESDNPITVVVGKEKRVFLVEPFVLEENPFRVLMDTSKRKMVKDPKNKDNHRLRHQRNRVVLVDVDAILFEHMLWLMHNDCSSFFNLNLNDIIDFYAQDV
ncbi:auxin-responsive protein SAUR78 [Vigna umbellata]|uniref:auxin-responsive protein SAUR78 n=1 Tax=Vigna umbellata TaxID=87088 RepID=UPI001F5F1C83|nr:auxin-responsive protein SAUR78 [Vigna umbellata]